MSVCVCHNLPLFYCRELIGIASSETPSIIEKEGNGNASQAHSRDVKHELIRLSLPAIAGQAIEPMAQLMETAYIGRLGKLVFVMLA